MNFPYTSLIIYKLNITSSYTQFLKPPQNSHTTNCKGEKKSSIISFQKPSSTSGKNIGKQIFILIVQSEDMRLITPSLCHFHLVPVIVATALTYLPTYWVSSPPSNPNQQDSEVRSVRQAQMLMTELDSRGKLNSNKQCKWKFSNGKFTL